MDVNRIQKSEIVFIDVAIQYSYIYPRLHCRTNMRMWRDGYASIYEIG